MSDQRPVARDPWHALAAATPARVALGRAGAALPTSRHLDLQLAHARARDAVWRAFDAGRVEGALIAQGREVIRIHSDAADRQEFLRRPDRGRRVRAKDLAALSGNAGDWDVGFVLGDGLASAAAECHGATMVEMVTQRLDPQWRVAPVIIAEQARVAIGDAVGAALGLRIVVVLLGERPGMSAQDSLGAYVTWSPRAGRTDAERNCVSNIRPAGLGYEDAASTIAWLLHEAMKRELTGVNLRVGLRFAQDDHLTHTRGGAA